MPRRRRKGHHNACVAFCAPPPPEIGCFGDVSAPFSPSLPRPAAAISPSAAPSPLFSSFPPPLFSVIPAPERESAPRGLRCLPHPAETVSVRDNLRAALGEIPAARRGYDGSGARVSRRDQHQAPRPWIRRPKLDLGPKPNPVRSAGAPSGPPTPVRRAARYVWSASVEIPAASAGMTVVGAQASRQAQHQAPPRLDTRAPGSVAPNLIWGPNPTPFAAPEVRTARQRRWQDRSVPRPANNRRMGPKSSLGRRRETLGRRREMLGRRRRRGEIAAAERGNDGKGGAAMTEEGRGHDGSGGGCGGGQALGQRRTLRVFWRGCWHLGHQWVARPPTMVRRMGVLHSSQGSLVRRKTRT